MNRKIHKIENGQFINIIGNPKNSSHPIKIEIASLQKEDFYKDIVKKEGHEIAWLIACPIVITARKENNFSKSHVKEIIVNYGDIFETPVGKFRLDYKKFESGELTFIK